MALQLNDLKSGDKFTVMDYPEVYVFKRIQGLYTLCLDEYSLPVHFSWNTPVHLIEEKTENTHGKTITDSHPKGLSS